MRYHSFFVVLVPLRKMLRVSKSCSLVFQFVGEDNERIFLGVCVFWVFFVLVKNLRVGPDPDKSDGRFFFILLRGRSA